VTAVSDAPATAAVTKQRRERPRWVNGVIGSVVILIAWQLLVVLFFNTKNSVVPSPTAILSGMSTDGWDFYWPNIRATVVVAAQGWLWGNVLAIVLAVAFVQVPFLERGLLKLAVASYCLPIIAIGPPLAIIFSGDTPKIILAALSVFFTTLISMLVGLRSADRASLDLIYAYGGGSWTQLRKVRLQSSIPSLFAGLRIAAPAAMLGAIIGEYLGAERGLGVSMINSQQALNIPRTWGIALTATAVAGILYGITALAERIIAPWAVRSIR
jgi:ABC-type nitrate/sulfonate/bicarbonate transport system permease component